MLSKRRLHKHRHTYTTGIQFYFICNSHFCNSSFVFLCGLLYIVLLRYYFSNISLLTFVGLTVCFVMRVNDAVPRVYDYMAE